MKFSLPLFLLPFASGAPSIWPLPTSMKTGANTLMIPTSSFQVVDELSNFNEDVTNALDRYQELTFPHSTNSDADAMKLSVSIKDPNAILELNSDESYTLTINDAITINSNNQIGFYRALETLSQLVVFTYDDESYSIEETPISITDTPRFSHRGLLIDSARHFEPLPTLRNILLSMSYAKLNVMHWHLVDSQSFPFESKVRPLLSHGGSYSKNERYTTSDVASIVEYARTLGIRVMVEIDTPGHAASWCEGYPEICPSTTCLEPLNVASNATFDLIDDLFKELTGGEKEGGLFTDSVMHLGGDEVDTSCWSDTPEVAQWLTDNSMSTSDAYAYFIAKVQKIAQGYGRDVVGWEEIWNSFGTKLDPSTIIHQWLPGSDIAKQVTDAGYRLIFSTASVWYLDFLNTSWETMYEAEPTAGVQESNEHLVLGGEGCMWGETVDTSDVLQTIWPRAAAISERLWSTKEGATTAAEATDRYVQFRCLLNFRGIAAAPFNNEEARMAPDGPGGCNQRRRLSKA